MDLGLTDRVYVLAGASRGLGRACARLLAAEGARLVLGGRDDAALRATAAMLGDSERAIAVSGDLSEPGLESCLSAAAVARSASARGPRRRPLMRPMRRCRRRGPCRWRVCCATCATAS